MKLAAGSTSRSPSWLSLFVAVLPAHADEWSKTYNLTRQARSADRNFRRQHPRHDLGPEHDRSQGHHQRTTRSAKVAFASKSIRPATRFEIEVRYPHHDFNVEWGNHRVDIIIQMPREGHVNLRTGDGKIDIAGLKGEMDLHSGDGSENLEARRRQAARLHRRRPHHSPRSL